MILGLDRVLKGDGSPKHGIDRAVAFGPLFLALPMGVFGTDHFITADFVATLVPRWIPFHLFWAYFVGAALIAAALSIILEKYSVLAATLLSAMLFSFVLLMHVPNLATDVRDRFALAVLLRDLSFSAGALACAAARADDWPKHGLAILVRSIIAVVAVVFGVEHFLHPQFVPVVPLERLNPSWIPAQAFLAYLTGAALVASGLSMAFNWRARQAAAWLGTFTFVIVLIVYLPIMVANASDIGQGINYLVDTLAFSGAALLVAGLLAEEKGALPRVET